MNTILKEQADKAYQLYQRLDYEHKEGLIPIDLYNNLLDVVLSYLRGIKEQLDQIQEALQEVE